MKVLALDMSSKSTGWSVFNNKELIAYGCISDNNSDAFARIKKMVAEIKKIYEQYEITNVICEDVLPEDVRHNQNVFKVLHYLQAAVVLMLHEYNQKVEFYVSSEWRKKCGIRTGRGITRDMVKAADIKFVKDNYGLDVNDDIADAICIGYAYTHPTTSTAARESAF